MNEKRDFRRLRRLLLLLLAAAVFCQGVRLGYGSIRYRAFFSRSVPCGAYRGVLQDFVPQGVTQDAHSGAYLVCGYRNRGRQSRLYVYDPNGEVRHVELQMQDGAPYTGHAGGVTAIGDYVYISSNHRLFLLRTADVLAAEDGSALSFRSAVPVPCNASFCSSDGQFLYVGEYHADGYATDASHALTFGGETFAALVFAYPLCADGTLQSSPAPHHVFVIPDAVQGFAVHAGKIFLSRSRGFHPSAIETYSGGGAADSSFLSEGTALPAFVLGSARLEQRLDAPHMSEDLEVRGGVLLIGFEAIAKKFAAGLLPATVKSFVAFTISNCDT